MGKNKEKDSKKKASKSSFQLAELLPLVEGTFKPLVKDRKVLLAFLGGTAVGIGLASVLGSEKSKEIFDEISRGGKDLLNKYLNKDDENTTDIEPEE